MQGLYMTGALGLARKFSERGESLRLIGPLACFCF
jgi:hypothetical protein